MKGFLVAACAVLLMFDGVVVAGGGLAAKISGGLARMTEAKTALIASSIVVCGAMFGCDRGQQMAGNMVAPVRPPAQSQNITNSIQFGLIHEEQFPQIVRSTALVSSEVNSAGGIAGRLLEAVQHKIYRDDRAAVVESTNNLAVRDGVYAIIGPSSSLLAEFSDEVAQIRGVPMLAIGATNPGVTRAGDMVFLTAFSDTYQGQMLAHFAYEDLDAESAAVLFWNENDYSQEIARSFQEKFLSVGGDVVTSHGYTYIGDADLASQLDRQGIVGAIAAAQPDVVVIPSYISDSAVVMRALRRAGVNGIFLGADSWGGGLVDSRDERNLVTSAGDAVEGAYFAAHFSVDAGDALSPEAEQFVDLYISSTGGIAPDALAALSYDAMRLTAQAAERLGGDLSQEKLRDEIEATINYRGATNIARYNERREPIKNVFIFNVRNGDKVFHKTIEPN